MHSVIERQFWFFTVQIPVERCAVKFTAVVGLPEPCSAWWHAVRLAELVKHKLWPTWSLRRWDWAYWIYHDLWPGSHSIGGGLYSGTCCVYCIWLFKNEEKTNISLLWFQKSSCNHAETAKSLGNHDCPWQYWYRSNPDKDDDVLTCLMNSYGTGPLPWSHQGDRVCAPRGVWVLLYLAYPPLRRLSRLHPASAHLRLSSWPHFHLRYGASSIWVCRYGGNVSRGLILQEFFYDLLYMLSRPVSEELVGAFLSASINFVTGVLLLVFFIPDIGTTWMNYGLTVTTFLAVPLIWSTKPPPSRTLQPQKIATAEVFSKIA